MDSSKLISEGWTKVVTFEGDKFREGLVSEDRAATLFEGEYVKKDNSRAFEGIFQRANTKNKNGRVYPAHILERETKKLQTMIKECGGVLGELDHPETVTINMKNTCLRLDRLGFNSQGISEGRMVLLPELPMGQAAIGCADALGGKIGVSSRGAGTLFQRDDVTMVGEDYSMRTYDIVHDPSTPGARPVAVTESILREFTEWSQQRPSTRVMGLAKLVDKLLGLA